MENENRWVIYNNNQQIAKNVLSCCIQTIYCCKDTEYYYVTNLDILTPMQLDQLKNYKGNYPYDDLYFFKLLNKTPTNKNHNCSIIIYDVVC